MCIFAFDGLFGLFCVKVIILDTSNSEMQACDLNCNETKLHELQKIYYRVSLFYGYLNLRTADATEWRLIS